MSKKNQKLTSVNLDIDLWEVFKINTIKYKFSFQKLAERCIQLYNDDEDFRRMIHRTKLDLEKERKDY